MTAQENLETDGGLDPRTGDGETCLLPASSLNTLVS
jgi:hypothetical protein